jgi:hypothetical protein
LWDQEKLLDFGVHGEVPREGLLLDCTSLSDFFKSVGKAWDLGFRDWSLGLRFYIGEFLALGSEIMIYGSDFQVQGT